MDFSKLPDLSSYYGIFTSQRFAEKISRVAKRAGVKLVYAALILYYALESDEVSLRDKAIIAGALGYLIAPVDLMPDAIPIAGLGDDLGVLIYILHKVWGELSDDVKQEARLKLSKWFDQDEIDGVGDVFTESPLDTPV